MKNIVNFLPAPYQKLTIIEKTIYHFLEHFQGQTFYLSQKELATKCHTSESAITRFIKKCGFNNYKSFIIWINQELSSLLNEYFVFNQATDENNTIADLITSHRLVFEKNINYEIIKKCKNLASTIVGKRQVIVYGAGTSYWFARELAANISRLGTPALAPQDIHTLFPLMGHPKKDEIFILFSMGLHTKEILFLIKKLVTTTNLFIITANKLRALDEGINFDNIIPFTRMHKESNKVSYSSKNAINLIIDLIFSFLLESVPKANLNDFKQGMLIINEWNQQK